MYQIAIYLNINSLSLNHIKVLDKKQNDKTYSKMNMSKPKYKIKNTCILYILYVYKNVYIYSLAIYIYI